MLIKGVLILKGSDQLRNSSSGNMRTGWDWGNANSTPPDHCYIIIFVHLDMVYPATSINIQKVHLKYFVIVYKSREFDSYTMSWMIS